MGTAPEIAVVATDERYELAEGPFWDPGRQQLHWVDIEAGAVMTGRLESAGKITVVDRVNFTGRVGAMAPSSTGDWVIAIEDRLWFRDASGALEQSAPLISGRDRRLNDGRPDANGRYIVGSLTTTGPSETETLVAFDDHATVLDRDLKLSNGLAWSEDGRTLFSVDTGRRTVFRRDWDPVSGTAGEREIYLVVPDGDPDGIALDVSGALWIALWGSGRVDRYTSDGELDYSVSVAAPHVSSVAFAGEDLKTLVITTASHTLEPEGRLSFPNAGGLFTWTSGVAGVPQPLWKRGRETRA